ncbi:hypothetical protein L1987_57858 [Smallanthus sonchifolius]|uniref:Uncharacterized protein n=1 Tax=Smallanthus sonchifolius TaxID=185202 RepID=A0ACB9DDZ1_9ASTR|nr:hypothetical protein L1987_57858 [Smallanthus sonchifolius]
MAYAEIEKRNEVVAQKNKEISDKESEVIKLHRKLEQFESYSVVLDYFNSNADPTKRVARIGFISPPFNANYVVEPEIINEEEIDPKTVLKVNPVTGEDMVYESDFEDEMFDEKKVEGIPKEVKIDDPTVVKTVTRDRCIMTEPEEVKVVPTKLSPILQSSGFVAAGYQKVNSSKVPTQTYVPKKPINCSRHSSEAYSSDGSSNSKKTSYFRNYQERRVCFHCNEAGHILINCPYKNQGKMKTVPSQPKVVKILKSKDEGKSSSSLKKNMPGRSFVKSPGFKQQNTLHAKSFVCKEKLEIPQVGISKDSVQEMKFSVPDDCIPCKKGKQRRKSHKSKSTNSIVTPLELLHMDLFGPISIRSIGGKSYCLVVTDDYSRFSWVKFLSSKAETTELVQYLIMGLENLFNLKVRRIRSDNGNEFKNSKMGLFYLQRGIHHEFSAPYVPQQNGVAERKNRTLVETARTMLADSKLPVTFWAEAVNTAY